MNYNEKSGFIEFELADADDEVKTGFVRARAIVGFRDSTIFGAAVLIETVDNATVFAKGSCRELSYILEKDNGFGAVNKT